MKSTIFALLPLLGGLAAAPGVEFRTNINPALLYYRALLVPADPVSEADRNYLESKVGREQKLPERFGKILASYDNQFLLVRQAAQARVACDWGVDVSAGPNTMLPHLARAKALCKTAQWRARWALQNGRQEDALEDLLAAFVLGRNVGSDRFLINALVQCMIETMDCGTVAQHFGEFSPGVLKRLVEGFKAAPGRCTMASCVATEKELGGWLEAKLLELQRAYPNDDTKVMAAWRDSGVGMAMEVIGFTDFWPRLVAASGGTSRGVLKLMRETDPIWPRLAEVMALPPPEYETRAKQLLADTERSSNPFMTSFSFVLRRWMLGGQNYQFRATEFRVQAQLAMIEAAVEYKLRGESGLKNVTDPFGDGPFGFRRFVFKGVDRGFELKSAYAGSDAPYVMIFVEKKGPAFEVMGPEAGKAIAK